MVPPKTNLINWDSQKAFVTFIFFFTHSLAHAAARNTWNREFIRDDQSATNSFESLLILNNYKEDYDGIGELPNIIVLMGLDDFNKKKNVKTDGSRGSRDILADTGIVLNLYDNCQHSSAELINTEKSNTFPQNQAISSGEGPHRQSLVALPAVLSDHFQSVGYRVFESHQFKKNNDKEESIDAPRPLNDTDAIGPSHHDHGDVIKPPNELLIRKLSEAYAAEEAKKKKKKPSLLWFSFEEPIGQNDEENLPVDQSVNAVMDYVKSSGNWHNTVLMLISTCNQTRTPMEKQENQLTTIFSETVRSTAIISGGYVEKSLKMNGVSPYRSHSPFNVNDFHATILGISSFSSTSSPSASTGKREGIVNMWQLLIQGRINEHRYSNPESKQDKSPNLKNQNIPEDETFNDRSRTEVIISKHKLLVTEMIADCGNISEHEQRLGTWLKYLRDGLSIVNKFDVPMSEELNRPNIGSIPRIARKLTTFANDYEILSQFYSETSGSSWSTKTNWMNGNDPCGDSWAGVTCSNERVTALDLCYNNLAGPVPSELGMLTCLTGPFCLSDAALTGLIPSQLGKLTALREEFQFAANALTGTIPSEFGLLSSLTSNFFLAANTFVGWMPSELGMMTKLTSVFPFHYNSLTGPLPSELGQMTNFVYRFDLQSNSFSGLIPSELGMLQKLTQRINLSGNQFCGDIPSEFTALSSGVSSWSVTTGNNLGTDCCETLPGTYTCAPTLFPSLTPTVPPTSSPSKSFNPSPVPTETTPHPTLPPSPVPTPPPTPLPTSIPTLPPSPVPTPPPTPLPTSIPTLPPSPVPTPPPTPLPTSLPTIIPSPVPTINCVSGKYLDVAANLCVDCAAGYYSNHTATAPFPTSCKLCPQGKYTSIEGEYECGFCLNGKFSNSERTSCDSCEEGEYTSNNACFECESGKYTPVPIEDACLDCPVGYFTNAITGSKSCTACSAGQFSANVSTDCDQCTAGKYQSSSGQTSCSPCVAGRYSQVDGASACLICSTGATSVAGSSSCDIAEGSYYLFNSETISCPKNAECVGTYQTPVPDVGYWVDRRSYKVMGNIHKCSRLTCTNSRNPLDSCWTVNSTNSSFEYKMNGGECGSTKLLCSEGAQGPLCGSCKSGYIFQSESSICKACTDSSVSYRVFIIAGFLISAILSIFFILHTKNEKTNVAKKFLSGFDSGSLKVLWVTYQIIISCSWNLDVNFPFPFNNMLGVMTIFSFDFLSLECFQSGSAMLRYFIKLYMLCFLPIVVVVVIVLIGGLRIFVGYCQQQRKTKAIINQHIWMILFVSYLVLPPVANKQFQSLDCITLKEEKLSFLRADSAIDCNSNAYKQFQKNLIIFIMIYQSIPVLWFVLLYRNKQELYIDNPNHDETLALYVRDNNKSVQHLRFLFNDYRISKWWFEVLEMYRRIIFIGILPLVSTVTSKRASFGCYLAIVSVLYFREIKPYRLKFTNHIAYVAQVAILITFFTAICLELGVMMVFGMDNFQIGCFLVLCNMSMFMMVVYIGVVRFQKSKKLEEDIQSKAEKIEWAVGFSANKFRSTFDSINKTSVPVSDILVFHYTSFQLARMAMRSGIPAIEIFDGIPFTLRPPHQIGSSEDMIFGAKDVLLVLSLPRALLKPLKGFAEENYLCYLSLGILKAMRSMSPSNVFDLKPWKDGIVMLPPTCILRSYQLVADVSSVQSRSVLFGRVHRATVKEHGFQQLWDVDNEEKAAMYDMKDVIQLQMVDDYLDAMKLVHEIAEINSLVPLYHYTIPGILPLILKGGMRMSTQGQGDGGVYFSLRSPLSYGLGQEDYEENIIKDCFGVERLEEYRGKGKLDALIVYGCEADVLVQAPGGRDNAKMIPKPYFSSMMLPQTDGNYFLRPDNILAVFVIHKKAILNNEDRQHECNTLIQLDEHNGEQLSKGAALADIQSKKLVTFAKLYSKDNVGSDGRVPLRPLEISQRASEETEGHLGSAV